MRPVFLSTHGQPTYAEALETKGNDTRVASAEVNKTFFMNPPCNQWLPASLTVDEAGL